MMPEADTPQNETRLLRERYALPYYGSLVLWLTLTLIGIVLAGRHYQIAVFQVGLVALFFLAFLFLLWRGFAGRKLVQVLYQDFAKKHGFTYVANIPTFQQVGPIMNVGHSHKTRNAVYGNGPDGRPCFLVEHQLTIGYGKNSETIVVTVGGLSIAPVNVHLFLASTSLQEMGVVTHSAITATFRSAQKYQLEGDFNKAYTLFGEAGDPVDLLEVINPAAMEKLLQLPQRYDIELFGDSFRYYDYQPAKTLQDIEGKLSQLYALEALFEPTLQNMRASMAVATSTPVPVSPRPPLAT